MARKASAVKISFARPERQADKAIALCQKKGLLRSVGTYRNYRECLKLACGHLRETRQGDLLHITRETAVRYLNDKAGVYAQKTLDMHRQSLQCFLHARGVLTPGETLEVVKSQRETQLHSRFYTPEQVKMIAAAQSERNGLSTRLAHECGLRAHELITIHRIDEGRPVDERHYTDGSLKSLPSKFEGMGEGKTYAVTGKGGLTREVFVPSHLVEELEAHRLTSPMEVVDRGVIYRDVKYDLAGGQAWSRDFSAVSKRELGWSRGAHGLRHSYAQDRMAVLVEKYDYRYAKETVSQELGHFRPDITDTYLR